jgi:hypothetical protein
LINFALSCVSAATGSHANKKSYDNLQGFQEKFTRITKISVTNPKTFEIRNASMSGQDFEYSNFNIVDNRNHQIKNIKGVFDTSFGPIKTGVSQSGKLTLTAAMHFIIHTDLLVWFADLLRGAE